MVFQHARLKLVSIAFNNLTAQFCVLAQIVSSVEWHRKGDYISTVMPADILLMTLFCFYC